MFVLLVEIPDLLFYFKICLGRDRLCMLFFQVNSILPKLLADNDNSQLPQEWEKMQKISLDIPNYTLLQLAAAFEVFLFICLRQNMDSKSVHVFDSMSDEYLTYFLSKENHRDSSSHIRSSFSQDGKAQLAG